METLQEKRIKKSTEKMNSAKKEKKMKNYLKNKLNGDDGYTMDEEGDCYL